MMLFSSDSATLRWMRLFDLCRSISLLPGAGFDPAAAPLAAAAVNACFRSMPYRLPPLDAWTQNASKSSRLSIDRMSTRLGRPLTAVPLPATSGWKRIGPDVADAAGAWQLRRRNDVTRDDVIDRFTATGRCHVDTDVTSPEVEGNQYWLSTDRVFLNNVSRDLFQSNNAVCKYRTKWIMKTILNYLLNSILEQFTTV